MVAFFKYSSLLGAFLFATGFAVGQQHHDGYTRPYKEMEKELNPSTLSVDKLIVLLDDPRFYAREVATRELTKRGPKHSSEVLNCMATGSAEARWRAEEIMRSISSDLLKAQEKHFAPTLNVKAKSPRYWCGVNNCLGGIIDRSLDCDVEIKSNCKLKAVTTPVTVLSAITDNGEILRAQVWKQNNGAENSASLFLVRPIDDFTSVSAEVVIKGIFQTTDLVELPWSEQTKVIREDICWVSIRKQIEDKTKEEHALIVVTDLLGRLGNVDTIQLLRADGSLVKPEITSNSCSFRRCWRFPVTKNLSQISKLKFKITGPELPFEQKFKVIVQSPDGPKG